MLLKAHSVRINIATKYQQDIQLSNLIQTKQQEQQTV